MIDPIAESFSTFKWKAVSYDPENVKYVTYECLLCRATIKERDNHLTEALIAHQGICASATS